MPITDPATIARLKALAGQQQAAPPAVAAGGSSITDPATIQRLLRLRAKDEIARRVGAQMPDAKTGEVTPPEATGGPPTMARSRVTQAFETAADPRANQPFPLPPRTEYDFQMNTTSHLPFGDEVMSLGSGINRYIAGKSGEAPEKSFADAWNYGRAINRAAQEQYQQNYPWRDIGGQALGIAALAPTGGAAALGIRGAPAANVAKTFLPTKGSLGRLGQATLAGEVMGGLSGAGEGEGVKDRAFNAMEGVLGGGLTSMGLSSAIEGGVGLGTRLLSPVATAAANRARPESQAVKIAAQQFERDRVPIAEAERRLRAGGPDMVLADVGGANVQGLTRTAVNVPGAARERITSFVRERNLRQPQRIVDAVKSVLKDPADFGRTTARMAAEREKIASPIYKQAFAKNRPVNVNGVVSHIDRIVKPGGISAMSDLRPDGITATLTKLRGYFQTARSQRVGLEQLHNVKMEIDDAISSALRSGDNNKARAMLGVQRELLKAMDASSPEYARARGIYSSSHETERALEVGRNAFKMTADDMQEALRGMTAGEKEMVQVGLARAIQDQMEAKGASEFRSSRDVLKTVFGSPKIMKTLRAAFQDEPAFRRFRATLLKEADMAQTAQSVGGNSTTAQQMANIGDFQKGISPDVFTQLMRGQPVQASATWLRQAISSEKGINEKVADKIGDLLLSNDPTKMRRAIQLLNMRQGAAQRIAARMAATQKLFGNEAYGVGEDVARRTPVVGTILNRLSPASPAQ
jgi:hypothetical protein